MKRDHSRDRHDGLAWTVLTLAILFVLAFFYQHINLTETALGAEPEVEVEEIRQNDYYCNQIVKGEMRVDPKEVSANQLLALCAKYL